MSNIFICYRREDSSDITGRIFDGLVAEFGREAVFIDVDNIPFGVDFREQVREAVDRCDVLLAVIGNQWFTVVDETGQPRLMSPDDHVRLEIERALQRGIPIVPVLVHRASMPEADRLPEGLSELSFRNAAEINSGAAFRADFDRLLHSIKKLINKGQQKEISGLARSRDTTTPMANIQVHRDEKGRGRLQWFTWTTVGVAGIFVLAACLVIAHRPRAGAVPGSPEAVAQSHFQDEFSNLVTPPHESMIKQGPAYESARPVYFSPMGDNVGGNPRYVLVRTNGYYSQPGDTLIGLVATDTAGNLVGNAGLDRFLTDLYGNRDKQYMVLLIEPSGLQGYELLSAFTKNKYPELRTIRLPFLPVWRISADIQGASPVTFRPRWSLSGAKGSAYFVLEAQRVSRLDVAVLEEALDRVAQMTGATNQVPGTSVGRVIRASVPESDFEAVRSGPSIRFQRRPNSLGENLQTIQSGTNSLLLAKLRSLDRDRFCVILLTYVDSFEAFYAVRAIAWQMGFDVDWLPLEMGRLVEFRVVRSSSAAYRG